MSARTQQEWPMRFKPVPEPAKPITFKMLGVIEEVNTTHHRYPERDEHRATVSFLSKDRETFRLKNIEIPDSVIKAAISESKRLGKVTSFEVVVTVRPLDKEINWEDPS